MFSEILYLVFDELVFRDNRKNQESINPIEYFLQCGHTSGTDTLTGLVFGLWSLTEFN